VPAALLDLYGFAARPGHLFVNHMIYSIFI
jgi:hypothetical protein